MTEPGPRLSSGRDVASAVFALPPVALVGLALLMAFDGGAATVPQWIPYAVAIAIAIATLAAVGAMPPVSRAATPALCGLAGLIAWSAASLTWTASRESTIISVARLALLGSAFVVGAIFAARPRSALVLAAAVFLAGCAVALLAAGHLLVGDLAVLRSGRLAWPVSYANGAAASMLMAVPAGVAFAAAQPLRPVVRAIAAGAATCSLVAGLATQSRAGTFAVVVALAVTAFAARDRGRVGLTLLPIALAAAGAVPVVATHRIAGSGDARRVGIAIIAAACVAAVLVLALAMLDRRERLPAPRRAARLALALWTLIGLAAVAAFVATVGNPGTWAADRWSEFSRSSAAPTGPVVNRFETAESNRYEYYRVGMLAARAHPLAGVGAGAFSVPWFRDRRVDESIDDAHSWQIGTLAELGGVGLVLIAFTLLAPFAGARRARSGRGAWPIAGTALTGSAAYFVAHASADWLLRIPSIAVPGFVLLGALAGAACEPGRPGVAGGRQRSVLAIAGGVVLLLAIPPYLSQRLANTAERQAVASLPRAAATLQRAASLDPFAVKPLELRAQILLADGLNGAALRSADQAVTRGPNDWTAWVVLAQVRAVSRTAGTADALRRARTLNPRWRASAVAG